MLYHVSVALDFSEEHLIVGHIISSSTAALASSASSNSLSTAASASHRHSLSTCESMATCEGGATPTSPPTRNGRLDEALAPEGPLPAAPQPLPPSVGVGPPAGKAGDAAKAESPAAEAPSCVAGGAGVGAAEEEAPPAVVHQVLNTIHESAEPPAQRVNGPAEPPAAALVQRRPAPSSASQPTPIQGAPDASAPHAHSE